MLNMQLLKHWDGVIEEIKVGLKDTSDSEDILEKIEGLKLLFFQELVDVKDARNLAVQRIAELEATIDTPQTEDFIEAVKNEAAHQSKRWGGEHDDTKAPEDWMWLLGWLISKAVQQPDKRLHHIVTSAAALAQWHRQETERHE